MIKFLFRVLAKLPPFSLVALLFRHKRKLPGLLWVGGLGFLAAKKFGPQLSERFGMGGAAPSATGAAATPPVSTASDPAAPSSPTPTPTERGATETAPTSDLEAETTPNLGMTGLVAEEEPSSAQVGMPLSSN